ncbi:MAG: Vitamin B12 transporter BtuB [Stenotrophomonas maltophilia]|nr:MAG: Vitamin B12 transporter BtuB [Stenotrophomonas maltophilia]
MHPLTSKVHPASPRFLRSRLFAGMALTGACLAAHGAQVDAAAEPQATALQTVTVTGTRGEKRTVANSPAPIDVIDRKQLESAAGKSGLQEALARLLPSFNLPAMTGSGANGVVRTAGLRGLNADQTLILVNGKRRHNSGLLQSGSWTSGGSTPVDLDMIPISAIDHIEVLRDGASAQYGSDAIAGVINIILKQTDNGGQATTSFGRNYQRDGLTRQQNADAGFALPNDGFLHLAVDNRDQDAFSRADDATIYYPNSAGQPVASGKQLLNLGYGNPESKSLTFSYNAELPLNDSSSLYSFSTYGWRHGSKYSNFRQPTNIDSFPTLYPDGFSPRTVVNEKDFQVTFGGKSEFAGWQSDLSTSYSRDDIELRNDHTLNPTLGPSSPTSFRTGGQVFEQWTNNFDLTRQLEIGMAKPMQLSLGLEARHESWELEAGEPLSYADGGYIVETGRYAGQVTDRSQGVQGTTPDDADKAERNVYAAYVDLGFYPTRSGTSPWPRARSTTTTSATAPTASSPRATSSPRNWPSAPPSAPASARRRWRSRCTSRTPTCSRPWATSTSTTPTAWSRRIRTSRAPWAPSRCVRKPR